MSKLENDVRAVFKAVVFVGVVAVTTGCAQFPQNPFTAGQQGDVAIADSASRAHLQDEPTMADFLAFSEQVTNKMLASPFVANWGTKKPRLVVGNLLNNTHNENIRVGDLHDRIQETLLNSGLVRILDKGATSFDYIIRSEVTSTRQYGAEGKRLSHYTMQLKMFTLKGELVGQWSDDLSLAKGPRRMF